MRIFGGFAAVLAAFIALGHLFGHLPGGTSRGSYTVAQTTTAFSRVGIRLENYWGGPMPSFSVPIALTAGKEVLSPTSRRFQHRNGGLVDDDFYVHVFDKDQDAEAYAIDWRARWAVFRRQGNVVVEGNARAKRYGALFSEAFRRLAASRVLLRHRVWLSVHGARTFVLTADALAGESG